METRPFSPADRSSAEAVQQQQQQHSDMTEDVQQRFALTMDGRLESRWLERCGEMELTFAMVCLCDPTAQGRWPLITSSLVTELVTNW